MARRLDRVERENRDLKQWGMVLILGLFLTACAGATPQESLRGLDTKSKDATCIRECTYSYSTCISNASISGGNRLVANDVIRACGGALRICSDTCPDLKSLQGR